MVGSVQPRVCVLWWMIVISPLTHSDDSRTLKSGITVPNCQSPWSARYPNWGLHAERTIKKQTYILHPRYTVGSGPPDPFSRFISESYPFQVSSYHVHITFHEPGTIWTYFIHSKILSFPFSFGHIRSNSSLTLYYFAYFYDLSFPFSVVSFFTIMTFIDLAGWPFRYRTMKINLGPVSTAPPKLKIPNSDWQGVVKFKREDGYRGVGYRPSVRHMDLHKAGFDWVLIKSKLGPRRNSWPVFSCFSLNVWVRDGRCPLFAARFFALFVRG